MTDILRDYLSPAIRAAGDKPRDEADYLIGYEPTRFDEPQCFCDCRPCLSAGRHLLAVHA